MYYSLLSISFYATYVDTRLLHTSYSPWGIHFKQVKGDMERAMEILDKIGKNKNIEYWFAH